MTVKVYKKAAELIHTKKIDMQTDIFKAALLSSAYAPNVENHEKFSDVSAFEINAPGYVSGGKQLQNVNMVTSSPNKIIFDADDLQWTGFTGSAKYLVIYNDSLSDQNLLCYFEFDSTKSGSGGNFDLKFSENGFYYADLGE
jgi:hypothetical protein